MTPTVEIPTGITVDGKPLEIVLKEMEDTRKKKEIREHYKGEILGKVCYTKGTYPYRKYLEVREPNGKVRRLTKSQIKKEYGKMKKTPSGASKIIANLMAAPGPVYLHEICKELGGKKGVVSATLSALIRNGIVECVGEETTGKRNRLYTMVDQYRNHTNDYLCRIFNEGETIRRRQKKARVKPTETTASQAVSTTTLLENVLTKIANLFTDELKARVRIDIHIHFE